MGGSDSDQHDDSDSGDDSDKELQTAFERGLVKPGFNVQQTVIKKEFINNKEGLKQALGDLQKNLPWVETLDLTVAPLAPPKPLMDQLGADPDDLTGEAVNDDFKREMYFYRLAQTAVLEGIQRLHSQGIPTRRPDDYFAEMAKTDVQMQKVRKKLLAKKASEEQRDKIRKIRENKKYGKKVQQEVLQKRQKEKKEMIEKVKKLRKGGGGGGDDKFSFLDDDKGQQHGKNPKREYKNKKFGFGGQKKRSKQNNKASVNDLGGFSGQKHSNMKKKGMPRGGNKNRPGKARRRANKSKGKK